MQVKINDINMGIEKHSLSMFNCEYKNGFCHGYWGVFYFTGQLAYSGYFNEGKPEGLWKWFNKDGTLEKMEFYAR
jgi:antitoxin component YwqK of YwqJK toxin-antitoxin module